ncbi:hypothetical protein AHAS_Ahas01G0055200 [Arachis hypogaea]
MDSHMGKEMRLVIILQFSIIWSRRKFRNRCFLEFKVLELASYLSRYGSFYCKMFRRGNNF